MSKTLKSRSASVELENATSAKRTIIDSIKMRDYESIMRRVIDMPAEQKNQSEENQPTDQEEKIESGE